MAFDYDATLQRIISKASILEERYRKILEGRNEALSTIEDLNRQIAEKDREIEKLRLQVEYLQMASTIAPDREQIKATKDMITGLVRDIDRCIADLSD